MQDKYKVIGGEFEIDLSNKGTFVGQPDTYYYASGRSALYQIIRSINVKRIWLPDYLCISIIEAVKKAGAQQVFYELDENLDPKIESIHADEFDAVLLIDYFGLKDLASLENRLTERFPYTVFIEDDVQAYYDFDASNNTYIHYRFTSLRKTFSVPDGGIVYTRHRMPKVLEPNTFSQYKLRAGDMKYHRSGEGDDSNYLSLFDKGEVLIDNNYDSQMSLDSKALFAACDLQKIQVARKTNAQCLLQGLEEIGIKTVIPVTEDKTPLFIPIWLEDRNKVRRAMFQQNVFCPVHWPLDDMPVKKGAEMAEHELSLIVDQRYSTKDMERILDILQKNI